MKRILIILLALLTLLIPAAAEEAPTQIHTPEDLLSIAEDPYGSYILMEDLDMSGIPWESPAFFGTLDGNGHAILNLTVTRTGDTVSLTYDGNLKPYDTLGAGMFSVLKDARIANLKLVNIRGCVTSEVPVFMGGFAGCMENSTIENCEITGTLELRACDRMYGIGGMAGYGWGTVSNCVMDVTLICVDTDPKGMGEQFLGGAFAGGYIHVTDCKITLDAYISEHGYVHSGGLTGMTLRFPDSGEDVLHIQKNQVTAKITFFEDNFDRRAYCGPVIGENLIFVPFFLDRNGQDFFRNEIWYYDKELRPEMCEKPVYSETVTAGTCESFGFTTYCCESCGYTYTDGYTLPEHVLTAWEVVQEATSEVEGLSRCACDLCGKVYEKVLDKLPPEPTETQPPATEAPTQAPTQPSEPEPQLPEEPENDGLVLIVSVAAAVIVLAVVLILLAKRPRKGGKFAAAGRR